MYTGYVNHTYNFNRGYAASYSWLGGSASWRVLTTASIGSSFEIDLEGNPEGNDAEMTVNARPYLSLTPMNYMNIRIYVDNLYLKTEQKIVQVIGGFLFSYNFSPKSWIYLALNEMQQRNTAGDMNVKDRAGVFKIKYLYYF
jgi:hypothetical protein